MTISVDDVIAILGRAPTGDEEIRINRLIAFAEAAVEDALPGFSFATGSEIVDIPWHDPDVFWTPRYPLAELHAVTIGGAAVDVSALRSDLNGKIEPWWMNSPWVVNGPTLTASAVVTVDYDFGLDPLPDDIVQIVAQMVADLIRRQSLNPGNVLSETVGSYSVTYANSATAVALGLVVPDLPRRWKRTAKMVSVPMVRYR